MQMINAVLIYPEGKVLIKKIDSSLPGLIRLFGTKPVIQHHCKMVDVIYDPNAKKQNDFCGLSEKKGLVIYTGYELTSLDNQMRNIIAILCKSKSQMIGDEDDESYSDVF